MTNTPDTIRQGDDAEYVYYTEEQLDEIVAEFVKEPADEEDRRRKMIVLKLVCDLRNYRGWAVDEIELLKGLHQRTGDQLDTEIKTSAYLRKEAERLREFERLAAELATEQRYAKEQAIKWNDEAVKLKRMYADKCRDWARVVDEHHQMRAKLNAKDTEIAKAMSYYEMDRDTIDRLTAQLAERDVTIARINWDFAIPIIERAFDIRLHEWQKHYLKTGEYTACGRVTGKTTAYCIKFALEHREPVEMKDIGKHRDENHGRTYPSWFGHRFLEVWDKLREAGFPVVDIIKDNGDRL